MHDDEFKLDPLTRHHDQLVIDDFEERFKHDRNRLRRIGAGILNFFIKEDILFFRITTMRADEYIDDDPEELTAG